MYAIAFTTRASGLSTDADRRVGQILKGIRILLKALPCIFPNQYRAELRGFMLLALMLVGSVCARAQGGPPYYTNDPGTPGNKDWEINLGYMPFLYTDQSVSHTPDVDINFGLGDRIQLTYENAWLRVQPPSEKTRYGLGQDQLGVKWRFYDAGEDGMSISVFPQLSINNPDHAVQRDITPPGASLILPVEFTKKVGPVDVISRLDITWFT